ncbi:MAG: tetratricopeptide repeat protein [Elusimicrobia bacterium]|nr:tetratricopeptide repeat protein [Elusimicrobiota bacterium]MDE2424669.1 tetratricopeptide repeat protein [Elusimicrobiota bacterium]
MQKTTAFAALLAFLALAVPPARGAEPVPLLKEAQSLDQKLGPSKDAADKARWRRQIEKDPEGPSAADAYLYLGQDYMWRGQKACELAIRLFDQAFKTADQDWIKAQAKGRIGQCLDYLGRSAEAQRVFKKVLKDYPNAAFTKELARNDAVGRAFRRGEALFNAKQYEQALALFLKIAHKMPGANDDERANALLMAGVQYDWLATQKRDASFLEKETASLRELIQKYPGSSRVGDAYLYLGQIQSGHVGVSVKPDYPKAISLYQKAIRTADRDWIKAQAQGRIGQCLDSENRPAEALAAYRKVLRLYPKTPWAGQVALLLAERARRAP